MPCVSEFYGVAIYFTTTIMLPRRARTLVIEWATEHRVELEENWERARNGEPLLPIESLE